jgi:eukaryotic-like serine/threonine-protein kinase
MNSDHLADRAVDEETRSARELDPFSTEDGHVALDGGTKIRNFGDYDLLEEIARGGMGVVYKAYQKSLKRFVALKIMRAAEFAGESEIQRFCQEAQAAASLDHPNIVPIHEFGTQAGLPFFSMGLVQGRSLAEQIADGPLDLRTAAKVTSEVARAVHYAHLRGVIHRDLKPSNILMDDRENPQVADFGLAKRIDTDIELTLTGQVMGTPGYMSPEQASGDRVTPLTDVYSLGALLYALLVGRPPFQGKSSHEVLRQVREDSPIPVRTLSEAVPRDLDAIILKCLNKSPHLSGSISVHRLGRRL